MNKHTPAPWYFSDNTRYKNPWTTNPYSITVRKPGVHGTTIANIPNRRSVPDDEKRANALLIAHAPELLGCVISMLRWYSNRLDGHNISPIQNQPPEIQRAMIVFNKITGENFA